MTLKAPQRRTFAAAFLKTMDPEQAARKIGHADGAAILAREDVRAELRLQRQQLAELLLPEDITRAAAALAFGRANDCVRLALEDGCQIDALDLTMLTEIKRSEKGAVEVRLADRLAALEFLAGRAGGQNDAAAQFLQAMSCAGGRETEEE